MGVKHDWSSVIPLHRCERGIYILWSVDSSSISSDWITVQQCTIFHQTRCSTFCIPCNLSYQYTKTNTKAVLLFLSAAAISRGFVLRQCQVKSLVTCVEKSRSNSEKVEPGILVLKQHCHGSAELWWLSQLYSCSSFVMVNTKPPSPSIWCQIIQTKERHSLHIFTKITF